MISFRENGKPFIVCRLLASGDRLGAPTHREAIAYDARGRALLGPATFPSWRPRTEPGERATWTTKGWVIVALRTRRKA